MFSKSASWTSTVLVSAALGVSVTIVWLYSNKINNRRSRKNKTFVPRTWKRVGTIKSLYMYPLKSGHYVQLESGYCDVQGMKVDTQQDHSGLADRSFILFNDKEKKFISSKQFNHLLLIETKYLGDGNFEFSVFNQPLYGESVRITLYTIA
ncbi:hypothetical protein WDU94_006707 [Cyamophila willieti]